MPWCPGSSQPPVAVEQFLNTTGSAKFARHVGKFSGQCPRCPRRLWLGRGSRHLTPRHKSSDPNE